MSRVLRPGPVLAYVGGIAVFCGMDALMKALVAGNPAVMATFWRYLLAIPFVLPFWWRAGRPRFTREMLPANLARAVAGSVSAVAFFWALSILPLAEAVTIAFVAPLMVPPLAALLLGERMEPESLAAGAVGFLGVVVAVGLDPPALTRERLLGAGAVLVAALAYAMVLVLTRMRAAKDGPARVTLLNALLSAALVGGAMVATVPPDQWVPQGRDWWLVLAVGATGAVALQLIALAYARAEAQRLAPFEYTAFLWAAGLGWLAFREPVSARLWLGALIIIAACLWQGRRTAAAGA